MAQLDLAKLKRLRSSVAALVSRSTSDNMSSGLPEAYMSLRGEVLKAVPEGLVAEVEALCPEVRSSAGHRDIIEVKQDGDRARAFLVSLDGWLTAVIQG